MPLLPCPKCAEPSTFSKKRARHYCAECDFEFDAGASTSESPEAGVAEATLGQTDKPLKLFLSYGRDDHISEVKALLQALRLRGHLVWFDEEKLAAGMTWDDHIDQGLRWCDKVDSCWPFMGDGGLCCS